MAGIRALRDLTVLPNQSQLLYEALREAGLKVTLHVVQGAGHGFRGATAKQRAEIDAMVDSFFDQHLKGRDSMSSS